MAKQKIEARSATYPDSNRYNKACVYMEVTECPSCHFAIEPKAMEAFLSYSVEGQYETYRLIVISHCKRCGHIFMSSFRGCICSATYGYVFGEAEYSVPSTPRSTEFSEGIKSVSPGFVETYLQAEIAESQQLNQISGIGYRKALEFLVKDYLCWKQPDNAEQIMSEFLGSSLKRIDDQRIKILAERSTWIGNDETHYVRKHEDLDVGDMKRFIRALLTYIESELAFAEALGIEPK